MGLQECKFAMGCLVKANPRIARAPREKLCSGAFPWDGPESTTFPKWLWDCEKECSGLAGNEQFIKGYMAVSYTWGGTTQTRHTVLVNLPEVNISRVHYNFDINHRPSAEIRDLLNGTFTLEPWFSALWAL